MLPSAVSDLTAELERGWPAQPTPRPGPTQPQPPRARQAELVICDKATERTHSWLNRFRAILIRWNKKPANYLAMLHLALATITWRHALPG